MCVVLFSNRLNGIVQQVTVLLNITEIKYRWFKFIKKYPVSRPSI